MPLPDTVAALIETFRNNEADYTLPDFKEAQLRQQFLDPLFAALGWDMDNAAGYSERYKEVVHEDSIRVRDGFGVPDYCFRVGGARKFFVEAKKPSVNIKDDPAPALQLRGYSWQSDLPLGILTDFQEISIYDTRVQPRAGDKAAVARVIHWRYTDLPEKWDEFAGIFSKEAVLKGHFDRYAETKLGRRSTLKFDEAFLADMENWRELLARNIALRNPRLDQRDLNFSVQRILDRLIFLRIAEGRGIEPYGQLQALLNGAAPGFLSEETTPDAFVLGEPAAASRARRQTIYPRLCEIFERADFRYNSGIFHFVAEKGRGEPPDRFTLTLSVDDDVLREIIKCLYPLERLYAFDDMEADILGSIYERFLGKTIRLTEARRAVVEEKPEVRKAGGVYYTPKYIVDYIVRETLGPLLADKTPAQVEKIKVLDPACGSGAFLIGAYQHLLDWHLDYYTSHDPQKWARKKNPPVYETSPNADGIGKGNGSWQLTTEGRKRILTNNIHGVDIDAQAVEITKLALLLKVLEGELREFRRSYQTEFHRILPDLGKNIHCGNSLVGHDFYEQLALPDLSGDDKYRINTFEWRDGFPEITKSGGFDAVIGNPPWIDIKTLDEIIVRYFFDKCKTAENRINIYACFLEKALFLLNKTGRLGMITPSSYTTQSSYEKLRKLILENHIESIVRLPDTVFRKVVAESAIIIVGKTPSRAKVQVAIFPRTLVLEKLDFRLAETREKARQADWRNSPGSMFNLALSPEKAALLGKISQCDTLAGLCEFSLGLTPYDKYKGHTTAQIRNRVFHSTAPKGKTWKPLLAGNNITRYFADRKCAEYINYGDWLGAPREQRFFTSPRILVRQIISGAPPRIFAAFVENEYYNTQIAFNLLKRCHVREDMLFILALINSRLMTWYHRNRYLDATKEVFQKILIQDAKNFPIRRIDFMKKSDVLAHEKLVGLAGEMTRLMQTSEAVLTPDAQTRLQREITATDRQIDVLVYQLYNLTGAEIALVEQPAA